MQRKLPAAFLTDPLRVRLIVVNIALKARRINIQSITIVKKEPCIWGLHIKKIRKERKLGQVEAAKYFKVRSRMLSFWENGIENVGPKYHPTACTFLGYNPLDEER